MHLRARDWNFWKYFGRNTRTQGRGEEAQLSSWWILIGSELFCRSFNSSVRDEQSLAIRYPKVVIKSLSVDICLNYHANAYFRSRNSVRVLSVADRDWKWKMLFKSCFSVALLSIFFYFGRRTSVTKKMSMWMHLLFWYLVFWHFIESLLLKIHKYTSGESRVTLLISVSLVWWIIQRGLLTDALPNLDNLTRYIID